MSLRFIPCSTASKNGDGFAAAGWKRQGRGGGVIIASPRPAKRCWPASVMGGSSSWKQSVESPESSMPDWKAEVKARLAGLGLSPARELEIIEELSQHLQDRYEQELSRGATEEEAKRESLEELNAPELLERELKQVERRVPQNPVVMGTDTKTSIMGDIAQDLRYGLRMLWKNPGFTIVAVLALALGIGANTAIFSVVNTVLLQPLPYKNPGQLVMLWENATHLGFPKDTPSPANFLDWRAQNTVFTGMAAMAQKNFNFTGVGEPERLDGRRVSANLFDVLGVQPRLGRGFLPQEDTPGTHVVILSHGLWQRRFGSDPRIIGQAWNLNGESYSVVGVMPPGIDVPSRDKWKDQLWVPIAFPSEEAQPRGNHYLEVIARMKPGITLKQAQAEMETIAARLAQQYPETNLRIGPGVGPRHEEALGDNRPGALVLLGAVGFVLLIACANVANLLLARAAVRQKEIALRLALGASRSRLTRQFLTESVLLATLGAAVGLIFAVAGLRILKTFIPDTISQADSIGIDAKVLFFAAFVRCPACSRRRSPATCRLLTMAIRCTSQSKEFQIRQPTSGWT